MEKKFILIDSDLIQELVNKIDSLQKAVDSLTVHGSAQQPLKDVLYTEDVCSLFKVNRNTVSEWVRQGKLIKINPSETKRNMFEKEQVYSLLSAKEKPHLIQMGRKAYRRKSSKYGILPLPKH